MEFPVFTGYLKKLSERFDGEMVYLTLAVPNTEVKTDLPEYNFRLVQPEYKEKKIFLLCTVGY